LKYLKQFRVPTKSGSVSPDTASWASFPVVLALRSDGDHSRTKEDIDRDMKEHEARYDAILKAKSEAARQEWVPVASFRSF
jgi:hypothetical protein